MRAFIAVSCPPEVKAQLAQAAERLKPMGDLKVVGEENMHLTLRFLGEVEENKVEELISALSTVKKQGGFVVCVKGLSAFPGPGSPRVLWAGTGKGDKELRELHEAIDGVIGPLGFGRDEHFSSHYTIARVKYLKEKTGLRQILDEYKEKVFGCFLVDSFCLMKSELHRIGPVYTVVREFRL
ncbi:MAG: RNA 2',3'-cyclic phosphodiesterase [Candidatus Altiarchaeia archaeon]